MRAVTAPATTVPAVSKEAAELATFEPTVLGAVRRYRWLVAAVMAVALALCAAYVLTRPERFRATASLVVQDPRVTSVFGSEAAPSTEPRRYVANQVAILEAPVVAQATIDRVSEQLDGFDMDTEEFGRRLAVSSTVEDNSLIEISFVHPDPDVATAVVDAHVEAYRDVRRQEASRDAQSALEQLDQSVAAIDAELADVAAQLAAGDGDDPALLQTQEDLIERRGQLEARRDQLLVDAELDSSGIDMFSGAIEDPRPVARGGVRLLVLTTLVGGAAAVTLAYSLALRRRRFDTHYEPELVLGAPLLADVPVFPDPSEELPVLVSPGSAAAEAFRFAGTSIQIQVGVASGTVVAFVSPNSGDGKSVVTANTAIAVAQSGRRVLVLDADREKQDVSRLLEHRADDAADVIQFMNGVAPLDHAIHPVLRTDTGSLMVATFGARTLAGTQALASSDATARLRQLLDELRGRFDYVFVDMPPLTRSALAAVLVSHADAAAVIVSHGGLVSQHEEVSERLRFIGTDTIGYVYNRAPLRSHWLTPYGAAAPAPSSRTAS